MNRLVAAADNVLYLLVGPSRVGLRRRRRHGVGERARGGLLFHRLRMAPHDALNQFPQVLHQMETRWNRSAICKAWGAPSRAPTA